MTKYLELLRNDLQGNADALIVKAQEVAKTLNLDQEAAEGNERLLRHYVSMGVAEMPLAMSFCCLMGKPITAF